MVRTEIAAAPGHYGVPYVPLVEPELARMQAEAVAATLRLYPATFVRGSQLERVLLTGQPQTQSLAMSGWDTLMLTAHYRTPQAVAETVHHELTHVLMAADRPGYKDYWRQPDGTPRPDWLAVNPHGFEYSRIFIGEQPPGFASAQAAYTYDEDVADTAQYLWAGTLQPRLATDPALAAKVRILVRWWSSHGLTLFDHLLPPAPAAPPAPPAPRPTVPTGEPVTVPYLVQHPPRRSQYRTDKHGRPERRQKPSGVTVLHTAENIMDTIGPDTGAEGVARFIRDRAEPGSYMDVADSDSALQLVPYEAEAYQDGTGSNPHAMSISWALRASDWQRMDPVRVQAFLHHGAQAFARQQVWLRANGYPLTPLRRISRAQSANGVPGFVTHGDRDPDRRSDPGGRPDHFPWSSWFAACASATGAPVDPVGPPRRPRVIPHTVARGSADRSTVLLLQHRLRAHGHKIRADGDFGPATLAAVLAHQRAWKLPADGIVGAGTWPTLLTKAPGEK